MSFYERPDLSDPQSATVRKVSALSGRSARRKTGLMLVEGPSAVQELIEFRPGFIRDIYFSEASAERHPALFADACDATKWVHTVPERVSTAMSPDSQGVLAVAKQEAVASDLAQALVEEPKLVLVLAATQDPGNLGTMIRQADAFGADLVIACKGSAEVTSPKVVRASTGSVFHLPVVSGLELAEVAVELGSAGLPLLAADGHASLSLPQLLTGEGGVSLGEPHAWLMGNEAHGLDKSELALCAQTVRVPIYGRAESLNVAAAAAVLLYHSATAQR